MRSNPIRALQACALSAGALWAYWPALGGGWVWDDAAEVPGNPSLRTAEGLGRIWTGAAGVDYFPLKSTVQWIEWHLWGQATAGYHLVSLGLHLAGAFLFWHLLQVLFRGEGPLSEADSPGGARPLAAWLGALIFAVHPLAVESVAWTAELKNALSLPLALGAMLAWLRFARGGGRANWALSLVLFILALLAKTTVVMLPAVMLLYLWWERRLGRKTIISTLPFFAASLVLGLVTVWFQSHRAMGGADLALGGWASRVAGAGLAGAFYAAKVVLPLGLMPFYPQWSFAPPSPADYWPWLALGALVAWLAARGKPWARGTLFGIGVFVLNLLPVSGLVPMAYLRIAWVADHFAYLPMLGLIGIAAAGAAAAAARLPRGRALLLGAGLIVAAALASASRARAALYASDEGFWRQALAGNPKSWLAHNDLGEILTDQGRLPEALDHLREAVRLAPGYPEARNNLGRALAASGRLPEAIEQFQAAVRLEPEYVVALDNLGSVLVQSGRYQEAIEQYGRLVRLRPDLAEPHASLGYALAQEGRLEEAIEQYRLAFRLDPSDFRAHNGLGIALAKSRRLPEAIEQFRASLRINPAYAETHYDLGLALQLSDQLAEASSEFAEAARLRGGSGSAP